MSPFLMIAALLAAGAQKAQPDNAVYPDVPDNHFAYQILREMKADGLLPEWQEDLRGNHPLTRGQMGRYIVEGTINLEQFIDDHRRVVSTKNVVKYSDNLSEFTGEQLTYLVALTPRLRKVAKAFSGNLPSFVRWQELDHTLDAEAKLLDGLLANE